MSRIAQVTDEHAGIGGHGEDGQIVGEAAGLLEHVDTVFMIDPGEAEGVGAAADVALDDGLEGFDIRATIVAGDKAENCAHD